MKILFPLCWFLLHTSASAGNTLPIKTDHGAQSPVPAGAAVRLILPEQVKLGDAIPGVFTVENTGSEPFVVSSGGDYRSSGFPLRLKVRVTDPQGFVLPDASAELQRMGGFWGEEKIAPGGSFEIKFPLEAYVAFPCAGTYSIEACHDLGWLVDDARPHPVAKARIKIVMPTADEASARVRDLCADTTWTSLFQLGKLQHEVFLPALVREADAGHANAVTGIAGIRGTTAFETLLRLLESPSNDVVKSAGNAVIRRLPSLSDPSKPAFRSWKQDSSVELKDWDAKYRETLLKSALSLLRSKNAATVELGAEFIQAQGDTVHAEPLLQALQAALEEPWEIRSGKGAKVLDPPPPLRGILQAIDALRDRGWRIGQERGGGSAVILARFRELADPKIPRPANDRWKQTVLGFIDANPPTFRQNAILAIPTPITDEFEQALMNSLEDKDWGVLLTACKVAGKSGRASFIRPLCQIVETTHETFVQSAASSSARALGARVELWEAWCEVITDQDCMVQALQQLAMGTLELASGNGGGSSNFTREQRFAIRDSWRAFIAKNRDRLARGERLPTNDPSISPSLTGSDFHPSNPAIRFHLPDGVYWPPMPAATGPK